MVWDGHIHLAAPTDDADSPAELAEKLAAAGVAGGLLASARPACFTGNLKAAGPEARLEQLLEWTEAVPGLSPFFWIDPVATDALAQVALAVGRGVAGFKIICDHYYPGDDRAMRTYQAIANAGKPILFHSGILWDGKPSGPYNRPVNFEALLEVRGLRFALAHISWPWIDECIAVYGKFAAALQRRSDLDVEMFIDTTPGTPPIYRREALTKLFTVGYDVAGNVFFGSDNRALGYRPEYAQEWVARDRTILEELEVGEATIEAVFTTNVQRFMGVEG